MSSLRIGVNTGGGDAPGLNTVLWAVSKAAAQVGIQVLGIRDSFGGLFSGMPLIEMTPEVMHRSQRSGGTVLGSLNRGFAPEGQFDAEVLRIAEGLRSHQLDALITVGGDGSLKIAHHLAKHFPVVGVPKTIDNDLRGTITFGFQTAVAKAVEALDGLRCSGEAHGRVMVLEVMGRDAGHLALHAGIAGGADVILIPEIPYNPHVLRAQVLRARAANPGQAAVVVVAEGAVAEAASAVYHEWADGSRSLGGAGAVAARHISDGSHLSARVTVLGYLQRGADPTAYDRWLCAQFGAAAIEAVVAKDFGTVVAYQNGQIHAIPLEHAARGPKLVDVAGSTVRSALALGIGFGAQTVGL